MILRRSLMRLRSVRSCVCSARSGKDHLSGRAAGDRGKLIRRERPAVVDLQMRVVLHVLGERHQVFRVVLRAVELKARAVAGDLGERARGKIVDRESRSVSASGRHHDGRRSGNCRSCVFVGSAATSVTMADRIERARVSRNGALGRIFLAFCVRSSGRRVPPVLGMSLPFALFLSVWLACCARADIAVTPPRLWRWLCRPPAAP